MTGGHVHVLCFFRELWRREAAIDQTIQNTRDELTKCERNLHSTVGKVNILSVSNVLDLYMMF